MIQSKQAWLLDTVRPKREVMAEAKQSGKTIHIGSLMTLCHEKHSELNLPMNEKKYKGRVVFRGDSVKDEDGSYAVFNEQGSSASRMSGSEKRRKGEAAHPAVPNGKA